MAIYQDKIAPPEVHEHLLLNKAKYPTPNALRDAITDYLEAKEQSQQNKDIEGGFVAGIHGKGKGAGKESDRHVKDTKFDKKKGKGKDKKGKGKEKGKEKGNDKGKLHKGLSKNPERSEARRFGGKCNWCWRIGHTEAQCWFKKAYMDWQQQQQNGDKNKKEDPEQKPEKNEDIRKYFKPKQQEPEAMDTNAVYQETPIYAIFQDEEFIDAVLAGRFGAVPGTEEPIGAKRSPPSSRGESGCRRLCSMDLLRQPTGRCQCLHRRDK